MNDITPENPDIKPGWNLPHILRATGSLVLILSLSSFLFHGWHHVDDLTRYIMLLSETIVLCIAGVLSIKWLNEPRGARTFVALALVAIPVNFAIMGGLLYAPMLANSNITAIIPEYFRWHIIDNGMLSTVVVVSIALLTPVTLIGYRIMARGSANTLTFVFILLNAVLLLPVRVGMYMNIILIASTLFSLWQLHRLSKLDYTLHTPTGRFARALIFIPVGIMFGRTLWMYGGDAFISGFTALVIYLVVRHFRTFTREHNRWLTALDIAALIPAGIAAGQLTEVLSTYLGLGHSVILPFATLAFGAVLVDTSMRAANKSGYLRLAAFVTAAGALFGLFDSGTAFNAIWTVLTGIGLITYGAAIKYKSIFITGIITAAIGLLFEMQNIFNHLDLGSWGAMALLGIVSILSASVIERHGNQIRLKLGHYYQQMTNWEH